MVFDYILTIVVLDRVTHPTTLGGGNNGSTGVAFHILAKESNDIDYLCEKFNIDCEIAWQFYDEAGRNREKAAKKISVTLNLFLSFEADNAICELCHARIMEAGAHKGPYYQGCSYCRVEKNDPSVQYCLICVCRLKFGEAPDLRPRKSNCLYCRAPVPDGKWFEGVTYDDANDLRQSLDYKGVFGYDRI